MREYIKPTNYMYSMIVGLILSDAWFVKRAGRINELTEVSLSLLQNFLFY